MTKLRVLEGDRRRGVERILWPIEIQFWCENMAHQGRIEDLSRGGVFISAGHSWPVGSRIRFQFRIPDSQVEHPIEGEGTVVWTEKIGFGIRFDELRTDAHDRIESFVNLKLFVLGQQASLAF